MEDYEDTEELQDDEETDEDELSNLSSSPSIPESNIDFNFVYALHTFQATVEGQATSQKGDTLELLDDTNSYWWLVKNLKDSSIGYLPAEHIETPSERLARLNKHRNVDNVNLQHHEQDTSSQKLSNKFGLRYKKSRGKLVTFASPQFIEYDVYEEEEGDEMGNEEFSTKAPQRGMNTDVMQNESASLARVINTDYAPLSLDRKAETSDTVESVNALAKQSLHNESHTTESKTHIQKSSLSSLHSDSSAASSNDDPDGKARKKKGMFGSLFKKKSKKEKLVNAAQDESNEISQKPETLNEEQTQISDHSEHEKWKLPAAVEEMRSSVLMDIDPIEVDMIEEPSYRGAIDEVEMRHLQLARTNTVQTEGNSDASSPPISAPSFLWNDSAINMYLSTSDDIYKRIVLSITHLADTERLKYNPEQSSVIPESFKTIGDRIDNVLRDLDSHLQRL